MRIDAIREVGSPNELVACDLSPPPPHPGSPVGVGLSSCSSSVFPADTKIRASGHRVKWSARSDGPQGPIDAVTASWTMPERGKRPGQYRTDIPDEPD